MKQNSDLKIKFIKKSQSGMRKKYRIKLQKNNHLKNIRNEFQNKINEHLPFFLEEYEFYFSKLESEKQIQIQNLINDSKKNSLGLIAHY